MSEIIEKLAAFTGLDRSSVRRIAMTAPHRYKVYHIAKRNGGLRRIAQPAREVKDLQRALVAMLLKDLPVHQAAMAYRTGLSIKNNAEIHSLSGPIIKMDFKDFFPSIRKKDWEAYCVKSGCLRDPMDIELTGLLLFNYQKDRASLRLAIGAPSSPMLSNIIMYDFDAYIYGSLQGTNIKYSRYADDLTFSAPRTGYMHDVGKIVNQAIKIIDFPVLRLNNEKTTYVTKKYKRSVTGLIIANDGRVTVGWKNKRILHAAVHSAKHNKLDERRLEALAGLLAFVYSVEPRFFDVLAKKYGYDVMEKIRAASGKQKQS